MGMKQLPRRSGEYLLEIIMRRHENRSTMMTSNRPLEDWAKLIGDVPAATAILDRFLQHAQIINITGKSYRLRKGGGRDGDDVTPSKGGKPDGDPKAPKAPSAAQEADDLRALLATHLKAIQDQARQRPGTPIPSRLPPDSPLFNVPAGLIRILDRDLVAAGIARFGEGRPYWPDDGR
jgi:hypothetical protein